MARIRTIKPEFPHSESMGRVSRDARLTFIELWTLADDAGRLRGNSRMLASLLFPYDDDAKDLMEGWLGELEREKCITRYSVDGTSYLQIHNWLIHQKIDKPTPSKMPAFVESSRKLANPRERSSLDLDREGIKEGNGKDHVSAAPNLRVHVEPDWWDEFKAVYPARAGDQGWREAQRAANARISAGHTPEQLIDGAKRYAGYCEAKGDIGTQYVKRAVAFLGPENHFLLPWTPPPSKAQLKQNKNLTASEIWLQQQEASDASN